MAPAQGCAQIEKWSKFFFLPPIRSYSTHSGEIKMGNKPTKERDEVLVKVVSPLDRAYVRWLAKDLERIHGYVPIKPRAVKPPDHYIEYMQMNGWLDLDLNDPALVHLFK